MCHSTCHCPQVTNYWPTQHTKQSRVAHLALGVSHVNPDHFRSPAFRCEIKNKVEDWTLSLPTSQEGCWLDSAKYELRALRFLRKLRFRWKKKNLPRIETRKQESPECLFSTVLKFYSSMLQFQKQKQKNVSMAHWLTFQATTVALLHFRRKT